MNDEIEDFRQRLERDLGEAMNTIRALRDENGQLRADKRELVEGMVAIMNLSAELADSPKSFRQRVMDVASHYITKHGEES